MIILGGDANALSIARSLGKKGIQVFALADPKAHVSYSRYCKPLGRYIEPNSEAWLRFLLGPSSRKLHGGLLLAASDEGIELIARNRDRLARLYLLDISNATAQLAMLDKLSTYQIASAAGVPTPGYWLASSSADLHRIRPQLNFPVLVKPRYSHVFEKRFARKFYLARTFNDLIEQFAKVDEAGIAVLLVEFIPGPDDLLCSYYTYMDEGGEPLFHFTKRIIRRYPPNMGAACYHVTDWNPAVKELALKLFRQAELRGLGNAEFKHDRRDGQLKLIECNARFTAGNPLVAASGYDLADFVYQYIVYGDTVPLTSYRQGMTLWDPIEDFKSFLTLRRQGALSFWEWAGSLLHGQTFPFYAWDDPWPTIRWALRRARQQVTRLVTRLTRCNRSRDGSDRRRREGEAPAEPGCRMVTHTSYRLGRSLALPECTACNGNRERLPPAGAGSLARSRGSVPLSGSQLDWGNAGE